MKDYFRKNMLIPEISIVFIVLSLFLQPLQELIDGFFRIQTSKSVLLSDFVVIGGEGPALLNSGLLMLISFLFVKRLNIRISGPIFAGILTIGGFAFFGKNLVNVSIVFLGVMLYSKYKNVPIKNVIIILLFTTGISPISSLLMFGMGLPLLYGIPLGILIGVMSGFVLVEVASHVINFHLGYDLYNVGFASGILSFFYFGVFNLLNLDYETSLLYSNEPHYLLSVLFVLMSLVSIGVGYYINGYSFNGLMTLLKKSGRAVTDFTIKRQEGTTLINVGLTSLVAFVIISLQQIQLSGPVMGGLMTIFGFAAFGKHVRNIIPPMLGVVLVVVLFDLELSIVIVLAMLFSTALAPLAGEHGVIVGLIAGAFHVPIVLSLGQLHGGILLYANGFAAAFTAVIVHTAYNALERRGV